VGLALGPAAALAVMLSPIPGLERDAHLLAGVVALVVVWWVTEALPLAVTALSGAVLMVVLGVAGAERAFSAFGSEVVFLFIGSFVLARAMSVHGLDRRMAYSLLSLPLVERSPLAFLAAFGLAAAALSMWVSNTATAAMLLPVALAVGPHMAGEADDRAGPRSHRYTVALLFMLAYASSLGGLATPVGTPPNLIGIAFLREQGGVDITFLEWVRTALPLTGLMLVVVFALVAAVYRPSLAQAPREQGYFRGQLRALGPVTAGERNVLVAFVAAVCLWVLPGAAAAIAGEGSPLYVTLRARLPEGAVAVGAAALLFVLPVDWKKRRATLTWEQAASIDWGTVLLFGGGIALGRAMADTGLALALGEALVKGTGLTGVKGITGAAVASGLIVSEAASNTASANIVVPVMLSLSQAAGVAVTAPALGATMGASFGFMLPVSTPPNALIYGTGRVTMLQMVRNGVLLDVTGGLVLWAYLVLIVA